MAALLEWHEMDRAQRDALRVGDRLLFGGRAVVLEAIVPSGREIDGGAFGIITEGPTRTFRDAARA